MKKENEMPAQHGSKLTRYYNEAQKFYDFFWHRGSFGQHYGFWDETTENRYEAIRRENIILANMAGVKIGDIVLDAGAGISGSGQYLAGNIGARVVSLEFVEKQVRRGRKLAGHKRLLDDMTFVQGDYHRLPFESNKFDIFWSLESIEHAYSVKSILDEAYRVLKPGGTALIAGMFKGREVISDDEKEMMSAGLNIVGDTVDMHTANGTVELLNDVGFTNVTNYDMTEKVMPSAREMAADCRRFMPLARLAAKSPFVSSIMVDNQQWGINQERLFDSGGVTYNVLLATK